MEDFLGLSECNMSNEPNFELVEGVLFDPQLRLRVSAASRFTDSYSDASIEVWFDPGLKPGQLTMPLPDDQRWMWERSPVPAPEQIAFKSRDAEQIITLFVSMKRLEDELRLRVEDHVHGFPLKATLLERAVPTGKPRELIRSILIASVRLPFWDQEVKRDPHIKRIAMYLSADVALEIGLPDNDPGGHDVGSRETLLVCRETRS